MNRIYFDYASTTPLDKRILNYIKPYFYKKFGNPSSLHFLGQEALKVIDFSRNKIANILGADFREIIFTSSATEANNLVLRGFLNKIQKDYIQNKMKIIISPIEHKSILETAISLKKENKLEICFLKVNKYGEIDLKDFKNKLDINTFLVSLIYANNENGIIQPIKEISTIINEFKKENNLNSYPIFHTDAVQALQFLDCNVVNLGVDLMTLSGHKIYGPKGIGILYLRNNIKNLINPIITGGGQEFGFRSGTENIPNIAGIGKAIELIEQNKKKEYERILKLKKYFWNNLKKIIKAELNQKENFENTLPNILNIYFPEKTSEELITKLDLAGIAVSSGSACSARSLEPSFVLLNCGFSKQRAIHSLRISFGKFTTKIEIDKALKIFKIL